MFFSVAKPIMTLKFWNSKSSLDRKIENTCVLSGFSLIIAHTEAATLNESQLIFPCIQSAINHQGNATHLLLFILVLVRFNCVPLFLLQLTFKI